MRLHLINILRAVFLFPALYSTGNGVWARACSAKFKTLKTSPTIPTLGYGVASPYVATELQYIGQA